MNNVCTGKVLSQHVDGVNVIECDKCGFAHVDKLPLDSVIREQYESQYYTSVKPEYITRYEEDERWWRSVYAYRLELYSKVVGHLPKSVIDIGSGPGIFLDEMKQRGMFVAGVEPNHDAWRYSVERFDLSVSNGFLEDLVPLDRQFDWAYLGEVLEHIPDPVRFLEIVREQLVADGVITIVVPNDFNPLQLSYTAVTGCDPWWVSPLHHVNYFNRVGLTNCLNSAGFDVIHSETTFPLELFLLMGDEYVGNEQVGRSIQTKRKQLEMTLFGSNVTVYSDFVRSLSNVGIGRELVVYAKARNLVSS